MTKCLITGCNLVDDAGGRWCHGDLHEVGDCYVFNACLIQEDSLPEEQVKGETAWNYEGGTPEGSKLLVLLLYAQPFERRGVIVVHKAQTFFNKAAADYLLGASQ